MYQCLHGTAPPYLMDSCTAEVTGRQHLRSATQRKLVVPRYWLNSFGRRRFSVAGKSTWNSLPDSLRDPELSLDTFKRQLKTYIFAKYWWQNVFSALEIFLSMRCINLHYTSLYFCDNDDLLCCLGSSTTLECSECWIVSTAQTHCSVPPVRINATSCFLALYHCPFSFPMIRNNSEKQLLPTALSTRP